jgi:hypothetical protein
VLRSITPTSTSNPHERSVFQLDSQTPSNTYSLDVLTLVLEFNSKSLREGVHATGKGSPEATLSPYPLIDLLGVDSKQSDVIVHPYQAQLPSQGLEEFLREKVLPTELSDALKELRNFSIEALEDGFELPSDLAISRAERLLLKMYEISPQRFEVYPTPDAEIAIRALAPRRSVILLCDSLGGTLCLVNVKSGRRRKRYTSADALPDSFLEKALLDLKRESI